jgi:protein-L-isoaspartate(D-aspartate) O-methyltransferase
MPRHEFVPDGLRGDAYADRPLPIGHGQNFEPAITLLLSNDPFQDWPMWGFVECLA